MKSYRILVTIICISFVLPVFADNVKTIKTNSYRVDFSSENAKLNGSYKSYYNHGTLKAEGFFCDNQRTGSWCFYDNLGKLILKRDYINDMDFTQIFPELPADESLKHLESCKYKPQRNNDGYFEYRKIFENNVQFAQNIICVAFPSENTDVINADKFLTVIFDNRDNEDFRVFEVFKNYAARKSDIESIKNKTIIAFKFKEEYFFDLAQQRMESRIVFICPIIKDNKTKEISSDNWFYFPALLKYLADIELDENSKSLNFENLSDVFFFNNYVKHIVEVSKTFGEIKPVSDIEDKMILRGKLSCKQIENSEKILIDLIETEHNLLFRNLADQN